MHEIVKEFLEKKKAEEEAEKVRKEAYKLDKQIKHKEKVLKNLGLYEKIYADESLKDSNDEFPYYEWDKETKRAVYYKIVPIEVSDEDFAEIEKYYNKEKEKSSNMFSGNLKKKIPKKIDNILKADNVTSNLWIWSQRLETFGKILFALILIFGFIFAIIAADGKKDFDTEIFFTLLLETGLYAFIEYCAYHVLALLIGALASIVQHTKITADVALLNYKNSNNETKK